MELEEEAEQRVFHAFRGGGFVELLGAGHFAGVGELLGMEQVDVEHKVVPVVEREGGVGVGRLLLGYDLPEFAPPRSPSPSPSSSSYRMLCFGGDGGFPSDSGNNNNNSIKGFSQKSIESCCSTSSSSCNSGPSKPKTKMEQRDRLAAAERGSMATAAASTQATARVAAAIKKPRKEQPHGGRQQQQPPPSSQRRTSKVRKEKLGERIAALQQLVSPFGKTDTASVLHEALGYIRFLHDQVQVLSSPYLQQLPSSARLPHGDGGGKEEPGLDLRSRGLCLVPLACTAHVGASNGADFWSPAMGSGGDARQPAVSRH